MSHDDALYKCPYFIRAYRARLDCDAGAIKMDDKKSFDQYTQEYCKAYAWKDCTLAKTMMDRYFKKDG